MTGNAQKQWGNGKLYLQIARQTARQASGSTDMIYASKVAEAAAKIFRRDGNPRGVVVALRQSSKYAGLADDAERRSELMLLARMEDQLNGSEATVMRQLATERQGRINPSALVSIPMEEGEEEMRNGRIEIAVSKFAEAVEIGLRLEAIKETRLAKKKTLMTMMFGAFKNASKGEIEAAVAEFLATGKLADIYAIPKAAETARLRAFELSMIGARIEIDMGRMEEAFQWYTTAVGIAEGAGMGEKIEGINRRAIALCMTAGDIARIDDRITEALSWYSVGRRLSVEANRVDEARFFDVMIRNALGDM